MKKKRLRVRSPTDRSMDLTLGCNDYFRVKVWVLPKCLYYYFKICGLAPINYSVNINVMTYDSEWRFTICRFSILYNLILVLFFTTWTYVEFYAGADQFSSYSEYDYVIRIRFNKLRIAAAALIWAMFYYKHGELIVCLNNLRKVNQTMNSDIPNKTALINKLMKRIIFPHLIIWILLSLSLPFIKGTFVILFGLCFLVTSSLTVQYSLMATIVEHYLSLLNTELSTFDRGLKRNNAYPVREEITRIRKAYFSVITLALNWSAFFSAPMSVNFVSESILIGGIVYNVATMIASEGKNLDVFDFVCGSVPLFLHFYYLVAMTIWIHMALKENKKTHGIIDALHEKHRTRYIKQLKKDFTIFLNQNKVKFHVYGWSSLVCYISVLVFKTVSGSVYYLSGFKPHHE